MNVFVRILTGPEAGRIIPLRAGQIARFGRTQWADFGLPYDADLADVHFELLCNRNGGVTVRNLDGRVGTFVDGAPITERALRPGQQIGAGSTVFAVQFELLVSLGGRSAIGPGEMDDQDKPQPIATAASTAEICTRFELEEPGLPQDGELPPDEFAQKLIAAGQLRDALRFQAFRFPKRYAVYWAWRSVMKRVTAATLPADMSALDAARRWVFEPTAQNAQSAGAAADALGYGTPAAWVAAAAIWSSDNMAPPSVAAIAPPDHLTGTAVSAALLLASVDVSPAATAEWQLAFLDDAKSLFGGNDPLPPTASTPFES